MFLFAERPLQFSNLWEWGVRSLIITSVALLFVEQDIIGSTDSFSSPRIFIWIERIIATLLLLEFAVRSLRSLKDSSYYPLTLMGCIDLAAIAPFYIGFFVSAPWLGLIRTLRILRLAKFYRYNPVMQNLVENMITKKRLWYALFSFIAVAILFGTVTMHEIESAAGTPGFESLRSTSWYIVVTFTTVGYGDVSPATSVGKVVASVLMVVGLSIVASFTSLVVSAVLEETQK